MNNICHNKGWLLGDMQVHIDTLPTNLIKFDLDTKLENYFIVI